MAALYANFLAGIISDNPLSAGATTINSANFANLPTVAAPNVLWLALDPTAVGGAPEIVQVTTHTASATSVTVIRGQQSTVARAHNLNTIWRHTETASDLATLPVALLTTKGDLIASSGPNVPVRVPVGANGLVLAADSAEASGVEWAQVGTAGIAGSAITTAKILDANVTTAKIADDAVTAAKLADDLPLGIVAYAQVTANQGSITTPFVDLTGLTVTFTAVSGRRYKVTGVVLPSSTVAGDTVIIALTTGANSQLQQANAVATITSETVVLVWVSSGSDSGSTTWKLRIDRFGSGTVQNTAGATLPSFILVEDIGA